MRRYQYLMAIFFSFYSFLSYGAEKQEWEYSFIKALNYEEKKEIEKAIEELERSRILNSKEVMILRELGYCYGKQGNIKKAKECYEEVLRLYPEDTNAQKNLKVIEKSLENSKEDF